VTDPEQRYAFHITCHSGQPFVTKRRLLAVAMKGIPDDIQCDMDSDLYIGLERGLIHGILVVCCWVLSKLKAVLRISAFREGSLNILNENRMSKA
jgi:hypothetical protein